MKTSYMLGLAVLWLGGCAATNSQQEIDYYAKLAYRSHACADAGLMDQETAAKGMAYASSNIYRSETPRFQERMRQDAATGVNANQSNCNDLRLRILTEVAIKEGKRAAPAQTTQPTYTNCSTYFGQTYCTTY